MKKGQPDELHLLMLPPASSQAPPPPVLSGRLSSSPSSSLSSSLSSGTPLGSPLLSGPLRLDLLTAPGRGPKVAPVTLVLFGAFDSYATLTYGPVLVELLSRHPGQVRFLFKHLPLTEDGRQVALLLAQLGLSSADSFFQAFDALMARAQNHFRLTLPEIFAVLSGLKLSPQALLAQAAGGPAAQLVERDAMQARALGITYGPALWMNGTVYHGQPGLEALDRKLKEELELGLIGRLRREKDPAP
jgi:protein-disulfide isomerase